MRQWILAGVSFTLLTGVSVTVLTASAHATPYDPKDGQLGHPPRQTYELYLDPAQAKAAISADLAYVEGMKDHHNGAVIMARDYLAESVQQPVLTQLAQAILANQLFEMDLLTQVGQAVSQPVTPVIGLWKRSTGLDGYEHSVRFIKTPPPDRTLCGGDTQALDDKDVRFAKSMIIHHQAALDMAGDYNRNPQADNRIIRAMNREVLIDQAYEIALMTDLLALYPGDADAIRIDPHTIPGMAHHLKHSAPEAAPRPSGNGHHHHH